MIYRQTALKETDFSFKSHKVTWDLKVFEKKMMSLAIGCEWNWKIVISPIDGNGNGWFVYSKSRTGKTRSRVSVIGLLRNPPWLWNPVQTSPEVQNRGISGPTKRTPVLQNLKRKGRVNSWHGPKSADPCSSPVERVSHTTENFHCMWSINSLIPCGKKQVSVPYCFFFI